METVNVNLTDVASPLMRMSTGAIQDKTKVVLIYPPITEDNGGYNTPSGLLIIASVLKLHGYNVSLVDCSVTDGYMEILEKEVIDATMVGVYAMSVHINLLLPVLSKLKAINPRITIVWGGPHAILFPEQTAKSPLADIVCYGEGEDLMLELLRSYEFREKLDLHNIKGICFEEDGQVITTPQRPFVDMDSLPFLDWSLLGDEVLNNIRGKIIRVQTSRGCPFRCTFCINVVTKNRSMRYRDPKLVVDELEYVYRDIGAKRVGFRDEIFISNRKQTKAIAEGILERDLQIEWLANPRVEYLRERWIDDDYLQLLVDSGCNKLSCGAESGSPRVLQFIKKQNTVEDIMNFVQRTKRFGISPVCAFLIGIPTETSSERLQTLNMIHDITKIHPKAAINGPANFRPYPGGELYNLCVSKYGIRVPDSLEEWSEAEILGGKKLPWIKDEDSMYYQFIWTSIRAATMKRTEFMLCYRRNRLKAMFLFFFCLLSKFRLRTLNYKLPFEFYLLDLYYKYIVKHYPEYS